MTALARRHEDTFERPFSSRQEILARYRHLRQISKGHLSNIVRSLSGSAILQQAKRLGLAYGKTLVLDSEDEINLAFDLVIHTSLPGRSRAIDRYAASAKVPQDSDEALMLDAMRRARFTVFRVKQRHPSAGLIVFDVFRDTELWLVDEGLEKSLPNGDTFATRLYAPDRFVMTAGIGMPVDRDLLKDAVTSTPQLMRKPHLEAIDDRRFAEAIYRTALAGGIMENMEFQDLGDGK